ncbi:MAG: glycerol-3-phosphate 1-O-acyltransferase PlsY, partial [Geminicoccaceae bacterium]|nr:glycerol-3-phosphate 1-O-acyltransferase PlsY [Geminicoccaceae bacterium]
AYLLGSIPFGLILAKILGGSDIRKSGSGNIGATNVARVVGPAAGILTLLLDVAKGAFAVWLAGRFSGHSATMLMLAGVAALLGHCFPVWLGFKGGKGVATGGGVILALTPLVAVPALAVFAAAFALTRYVSLSSMLAALVVPLAAYLWGHVQAAELYLFLVILVILQHRANIGRLLAGKEPKTSLGAKRGS